MMPLDPYIVSVARRGEPGSLSDDLAFLSKHFHEEELFQNVKNHEDRHVAGRRRFQQSRL